MTLEAVKRSIKNCELAAQREPGSVTLIAVSKFQSVENVERVIKLGCKNFGENRVQEACSKWTSLKKKYPAVRLHLLGPLQTNKVKQALKVFDSIHSLDREKLAAKLATALQESRKSMEIFVQVNFEDEIQKAGVSVSDLDIFVEKCKRDYKLPVVGLMCIPPVGKDPKKFFSELKILADQNNLSKLSMGMSADYCEAIKCGASHIRVGTAIFGDRN